MPSFFARRYGRPKHQVSTTERLISAIILLALTGLAVAVVRALTVRSESIAAVGPTGEAKTETKDDEVFDLPKLDMAGWSGPHGKEWYDLETVHKKINGRVGLYENYEMDSMTFCTYKHPGDDDRYIDTYVYDLGKPLNAFGCFKAEFAPGMPAAKVGREGYRADQSLFFWKGPYYVQLVAGGSVGEADAKVVDHLAQQIADRIDDQGKPLWGDEILPKKNRRPQSLGYEVKNAFSLEFLKDVFRADYEEGEHQYAMFIHRASSPEVARATVEAYGKYLTKHGKILAKEDSPGGYTLVGEALDMFDYVFCKGTYLGGVNGSDTLELAKERGKPFRDSLKTD